ANFMTGWDAMEVWNGAPIAAFEGCPQSPCSYAHPTAYDWFAFLDRGHRIAGTGNSDSHNASTREVGYPRNYLQIGEDDPAAATDSQIVDAVRGMKVSISGGPFLTISTPDAGIGGQAQADAGVVH